MNVIKEYNTAQKKKGNVTYGAVRGGKWNFRAADKESGAWIKIMKVRGSAIAGKIAEVISKSWLRTAGKKLAADARLDAKARKQIDELTALRTLKDWKGEREWWSNKADDHSAVPMNYIQRKAIGPEDLAEEQKAFEELISIATQKQPTGELVAA